MGTRNARAVSQGEFNVVKEQMARVNTNILAISQLKWTGMGEFNSGDGDCIHEIKRRLLLGKRVMANLDSILKSRDITLPTKVPLVKAMVFPVVMCGCESWTVKKAER